MDSAEISLQAYDTLFKGIPSIGFLSRKKRVIAFLRVTKLAQKMIDDEEISTDNAQYLISILVRKSPDFQKAAMATALNLENIDKKIVSAIGFKYANEMRCNMQLYPIED